MTEQQSSNPASTTTLGEALQEYLEYLKPEIRVRNGSYVRKYVEFAGQDVWITSITGSHVEYYRDSQIQSTDPAAPERVAALKDWFQFLKKRNYTDANFGVHVRVKKTGKRTGTAEQVRVEQQSIAMTAEGVEGLQKELKELQEARPQIIKSIQEAREDKDFRENSPLEAAREALAFNEQRQREIEAVLKRAVINETGGSDLSSVGSFVKVTRLDTNHTDTWKLVGAREANAGEKKISVESPVGKALLGKGEGDTVTVEAPSGVLEFRIEEVRQG